MFSVKNKKRKRETEIRESRGQQKRSFPNFSSSTPLPLESPAGSPAMSAGPHARRWSTRWTLDPIPHSHEAQLIRSFLASNISMETRLGFSWRILVVLTAILAGIECGAVAEKPRGKRRHAYASMMYMGTPRDYEFFVATRVMMRSLSKLRVDADLVVIASIDVPSRWLRALWASPSLPLFLWTFFFKFIYLFQISLILLGIFNFRCESNCWEDVGIWIFDCPVQHGRIKILFFFLQILSEKK